MESEKAGWPWDSMGAARGQEDLQEVDTSLQLTRAPRPRQGASGNFSAGWQSQERSDLSDQ